MDVNFSAILVAAVASMVLGFVWYNEKVLGKIWMQLTHRSMKDHKAAQKFMVQKMVVALIAQSVMAFVLAKLLILAHIVGVQNAVKFAALVWLGILVPVLLGSTLWESKSPKLWILNSTYWLVAMGVMAVILAGWS